MMITWDNTTFSAVMIRSPVKCQSRIIFYFSLSSIVIGNGYIYIWSDIYRYIYRKI